MASATQQHRGRAAIAVLAVLLTAVASPTATRAAAAAAAGSCDGDKFPAGRSYAHCAALPYLGARLHWTYDAKTGSLSVAFVARPAGAGGAGWVSWAINPTGEGMKGAQALMALRASPAAAYAVNTYNITGYKPFGANSTAIAFKATGLAADESAGEVRLYGTLQLAPKTEVVNHLWQVGSTVTGGAPVKHAFDKDNLQSKGKLALSGAALAPAPAAAAAAGSSAAKGGSKGAASPSGGTTKPSAATTAASAPVLLLLLALAAGFMAIV